MVVARLLLTSLAARSQPTAPATCLHAYVGLPADTPAEARALRAAILRRYPVGTPAEVANALRRAAFVPGAVCEPGVAARQAADSGVVENVVPRPRRPT